MLFSIDYSDIRSAVLNNAYRNGRDLYFLKTIEERYQNFKKVLSGDFPSPPRNESSVPQDEETKSPNDPAHNPISPPPDPAASGIPRRRSSVFIGPPHSYTNPNTPSHTSQGREDRSILRTSFNGLMALLELFTQSILRRSHSEYEEVTYAWLDGRIVNDEQSRIMQSMDQSTRRCNSTSYPILRKKVAFDAVATSAAAASAAAASYDAALEVSNRAAGTVSADATSYAVALAAVAARSTAAAAVAATALASSTHTSAAASAQGTAKSDSFVVIDESLCFLYSLGLLHPLGPRKIAWDMLVGLLIVYRLVPVCFIYYFCFTLFDCSSNLPCFSIPPHC